MVAKKDAVRIAEIFDEVQRHAPKVIELGLDRIARVANHLNSPQDKGPQKIHIAGTNGKGSTLAYLSAILSSGGHNVTSYSSPALLDWRECLQSTGTCNLKNMPLETLLFAMERLLAALRSSGAKYLTRFESETLLAFMLMEAEDSAQGFGLIETGMGGVRDATNIISRPILVILTPIALDHQEFLGSSLVDIAAHKLGILKSGVPCLMSGGQNPKIVEMAREKADSLGAPLFVKGQDWECVEVNEASFRLEVGTKSLDMPVPKGLRPKGWKMGNAALAAAAAYLVAPECLPHGARGLADATPFGRLQCFKTVKKTEIWLDGGHNPHAARALGQDLAYWRNMGIAHRIGLAFAMQANRSPTEFLEHLVPHIVAGATFPALGGFAPAHPPHTLAKALEISGCGDVSWHDAIEDAVESLLTHDLDRIVVSGSLRAVAAAMNM